MLLGFLLLSIGFASTSSILKGSEKKFDHISSVSYDQREKVKKRGKQEEAEED